MQKFCGSCALLREAERSKLRSRADTDSDRDGSSMTLVMMGVSSAQEELVGDTQHTRIPEHTR